MTKYCTRSSYGTVDGKTTLEKTDDVAAQKLGGSWRIPTEWDWEQLKDKDNCTWKWFQYNGKNGYLVISKKTNNAIFLPVAGGYRGNMLEGAGSSGYYWSSSLYTYYYAENYMAHFFYFNSTTVYDPGISDRCDGLSVRPVCDR